MLNNQRLWLLWYCNNQFNDGTPWDSAIHQLRLLRLPMAHSPHLHVSQAVSSLGIYHHISTIIPRNTWVPTWLNPHSNLYPLMIPIIYRLNIISIIFHCIAILGTGFIPFFRVSPMENPLPSSVFCSKCCSSSMLCPCSSWTGPVDSKVASDS